MFHATLRSLWSHKRRLISTSMAVILGVGFMAGTLVLNATMGRVFDDLFADLGKGVDVVVRGPVLFDDQFTGTQRDLIDDSVVSKVEAVPGVAAAEGSVLTATLSLLDAKGDPIGGAGPPTIVGSWDRDPIMASYTVAQGRAPTAAGELIIDRAGIKKGGFALGDKVTIITPDGPDQFTLVGSAKFGEADSAGGSLFAGTTLADAQRVANTPGQVNAINVRAKPGETPEELVRKIRAAGVSPKADVVTGAQVSKEMSNDMKQNFSFLTTALLVFAAISLFVGWFIISNTFSILVAQRTKELALMRAIGASRSQVLGSVLLEALLIGLVSSVFGFLAGIGLAAGAFALLHAFGLNIPDTSLVVNTSTGIVSVVVGLFITGVAALMPAIRATRVAPLAALRDVAIDSSGTSKVRTAMGLGFLALAAVLISPVFRGETTTDQLPIIGVGLAFLMTGVLVLGPVIARPIAGVVGIGLPLVKGVTGQLARENAMRSPRRTAATAAALIVGVALVSFITIFASSAKSSINAVIGIGFEGDYIIQPANQFGGIGAPPSLAEDLARVNGVETVTPFSFLAGQITLPDNTKTGALMGALDPTTATKVFSFKMSKGSITDLGPGEIVVDRQIAKEKGVVIGDPIKVLGDSGRSSTFKVAAISDDPVLLGQWTLPRDDAAKLQRQPSDVLLGIKLKPGVSVDSIRPVLRNEVRAYPTLKLQDREQYTSSIVSSISALLNVIYGLLAVSILIALIGIANTLSLSIHERTRELGLLRAMGMTRSQLRSSVRWEAVIVALMGTVIGIVVGVGMSWVMVKALNSQGISEFAVSAIDMVKIVVIGAIFAVIASIRPAWKASKLNVLEAIGAE